jgi:CRISPR-associated endonuclease/helicase Cas3
MAQTRLGKDSVVAIPMLPSDSFEQDNTPDFHTAKKWFTRSVSLSRKKVVTQLKIMGVPDGWKKSSLLRNCYPLILNEAQQWVANNQVRLDQDLGVVYERKEDE